jgi:hypothetical protein
MVDVRDTGRDTFQPARNLGSQVMRQFLVMITTILSLAAPSHFLSRTTRRESPSSASLSLKLSGPNLVQNGEPIYFRAFLINESNQNIEVPTPESLRGVIYLEWRVVDLSNNALRTRWAGFTLCSGKGFSEQDFLILKPGQRLELPDIYIPDLLVIAGGTGSYRISLRYAFPNPKAVLLPDDILQKKQHFDITSNELTVLLAEK